MYAQLLHNAWQTLTYCMSQVAHAWLQQSYVLNRHKGETYNKSRALLMHPDMAP